jgi:uncharacterized protein (TIGR02217 family)
MSNAIFPKLRGRSWSVMETPQTSTRLSKHVSGRTVACSLYKYPLYLFELKYDGLTSASDPSFSNLGAQSLQAIEGFFLARAGGFDTFLFRKSDVTGNKFDSWVEGQQLSVGDGTTTAFTFVREVPLASPNAPYIEPVGQVEPIGLNVYVNGTAQSPSTYSLTWPNKVTFNSAPSAGSVVSADYAYYFVCRFADDTLDFENFAHLLWKLGSVKLQTVKQP